MGVPKHCFFYKYLSIGRSNKKNKKKTKYISFWILLLGGLSPPSQLVPNPFNWSPKTVFYRYLSIGRSNKENQKTKSIYFRILLLGGPSPPSQLVPIPQPIQLVPKNCFLQITQYRSIKSKKFKKQS